MNQSEAIEIDDLALTEGQLETVKGGPVVLPDVLVTGFQHSGSSVAGNSNNGALVNVHGGNTWIA